MRTFFWSVLGDRGGLQTGYRHGLSNDEKKNRNDNFEMHLELGGLEIIMIAVVLIVLLQKFYSRDY